MRAESTAMLEIIQKKDKRMKNINLLLAVVFTLVLSCAVLPVQGMAKSSKSTVQTQVAQKIDINSADTATLSQLPGIGPKTAEKITTFRTEHGPFKSLDDLTQVKGIGSKKLAKIAPLLEKI
jgi:competence protein ComEA